MCYGRHKRWARFCLLFIFFAVSLLFVPRLRAQSNSENLFYYVDTEDSFQSFSAHSDVISVVAPQTYSISKAGVIWGEVDPRVLAIARENNIKVVPLVVNPGFDRDLFHDFLQDTAAQERAIGMMTDLAIKYKFAGWQFDFENIHITDRDAFTSFFKKTAEALHQQGLTLSAAVVPTNTNADLKTEYHRFLYEYWRGAYDLKALAETGDFLSLMTYSQHTRRTPPGPVAGVVWMQEMVEYMLNQGIDPQKISLGIPFYSTYWFADYDDERGGFVNGSGASYEKVQGLIERYDAEKVWLQKPQCYYALWNHDGIYEYAFIEDARSLKPKLDLLGEYNLRGISVWRLGQEDPAVWETISTSLKTVK
ncbi:MAG: glycosyl hydrolase family 18 protein [Balneolaceae bacterium]|jgi:spore germination protein YaaH